MQTTINPAPERGQQFTLTAETDADRELLDVIDANGLHSAIRQATYRAPHPSGNGYITTGATLLVDRQHPIAQETQTARQFLRAARQLCSLGLAQDTFNRHVGADAIDPEAQDQFAAVLEKLQLMLDVGARAIGKQERIRQEVDSAHCGLLCNEKRHHTAPAIDTQSICALQRRARRGILFSAINGAADRFHFWQGVASAAEDMINGNALRMAANDADASADQEQASLETAWAALSIGVKHLTMAEVQQLLAAQGIESAADLVAHRDIGAGQVLKNDEVAPIANLQDEHTQARADVSNGTGLHCMASSAGDAAMVGQQGGAA